MTPENVTVSLTHLIGQMVISLCVRAGSQEYGFQMAKRVGGDPWEKKKKKGSEPGNH